MSASPAHVTRIVALGYTRRDAAFLALVADHGGYFLQRQYDAAVGVPKGRPVVAFTRTLVGRRHATVQTFCRSTRVYHLARRTLYRDGADAPVAVRRRRPVAAITGRLMAVDLAIQRPTLHILWTEADRLAWCDAQGLDRATLPQHQLRTARLRGAATRFFPGPELLARDNAPPDAPSVVVVYLDEGAQSLAGFRTCLVRHAVVLATVSCRVLFVTDDAQQASRAHALFDRTTGVGQHWHDAGRQADALEFFRLRRLHDLQRWEALETVGLERLLDLRQRFGTSLEPWYERWRRAEGHDAEQRTGGTAAGPLPVFEAVLLTDDYRATASIRRCS